LSQELPPTEHTRPFFFAYGSCLQRLSLGNHYPRAPFWVFFPLSRAYPLFPSPFKLPSLTYPSFFQVLFTCFAWQQYATRCYSSPPTLLVVDHSILECTLNFPLDASSFNFGFSEAFPYFSLPLALIVTAEATGVLLAPDPSTVSGPHPLFHASFSFPLKKKNKTTPGSVLPPPSKIPPRSSLPIRL